jgi:hypothetical protein
MDGRKHPITKKMYIYLLGHWSILKIYFAHLWVKYFMGNHGNLMKYMKFLLNMSNLNKRMYKLGSSKVGQKEQRVCLKTLYEPRHDKINIMGLRPA